MKIMSNTLFVGIDISSQTIAVYFMDQTGKGPKNSIELNNDLMDATLLVEHILTYADTIKADNVKIGMESTSDYALHLHHFLASVPDLEPLSPQIYVLNPAIVNGFKKTLTFRQRLMTLMLSSLLTVCGSAESNLQRFQIPDILPYNDSRDTAFSWFKT